MFQRSSGILMHLSSLPSPYGIGGFGKECKNWIDQMKEMKMHWWQVLPLCPQGYGDSPYSSSSAFAISALYIDPSAMLEQGLITQEEEKAAIYPESPYAVNYEFVRKSKQTLLLRAFSRFDTALMQEFYNSNQAWLKPYAIFMASKECNRGAPWWEWTQKPNETQISFYVFEQYLAFSQWDNIKEYAHEHEVQLLGDMPIYVLRDSADFWSRPEQFLTDEQLVPSKVAGVPPDYFSPEGQLWGNPLYDWNAMKRDGYAWWMHRIGHNLKLYDAVRIDHFRGLFQYWAVPANAASAKEGAWQDGPKENFLNAVRQTFGDANLIAEDLGEYSEAFNDFLKQSGYPGMRVMQFGFSERENLHTPHRYHDKVIAYTGTHDNDTLLGWLWASTPQEKGHMLRYCRYFGENWGNGGSHSEVIRSIITTLWQSSAVITIVPVQDLLGFGTDTRMNIPGKPSENWRVRFTEQALSQIDTAFYTKLNETYARE